MYRIDFHPLINNQQALYTNATIKQHSIVFDLSKLPVVNTNSRYAITLEPGSYIDTTGDDCRLINHSCEPNMSFNVPKKQFLAVRDICDNEILTFDYLTTEVEMTEPFQCRCSSSKCRGYISGSNNSGSNNSSFFAAMHVSGPTEGNGINTVSFKLIPHGAEHDAIDKKLESVVTI